MTTIDPVISQIWYIIVPYPEARPLLSLHAIPTAPPNQIAFYTSLLEIIICRVVSHNITLSWSRSEFIASSNCFNYETQINKISLNCGIPTSLAWVGPHKSIVVAEVLLIFVKYYTFFKYFQKVAMGPDEQITKVLPGEKQEGRREISAVLWWLRTFLPRRNRLHSRSNRKGQFIVYTYITYSLFQFVIKMGNLDFVPVMGGFLITEGFCSFWLCRNQIDAYVLSFKFILIKRIVASIEIKN